jgi:hypothetical protein
LNQLSNLLNDPSWFPAAIDIKTNQINFVQIDRNSLSKEAFLDQRMKGSITAHQTVPLRDVMAEVAGQQPKAPLFIFHTAFCCSTLLARALDKTGTALSLKEPDVLMGLANALRVDEQVRQSEENANLLVSTVFKLLARQFNGDERIIAKPTNAANNLLGHAIKSGSRIVLLYGDLHSFLVSVLKKGEPCKSFVRTQYNIFSLDPGGVSLIPQRQAVSFTDLQIAALVWRHQIELFQSLLATAPKEQVVSLNFEIFLESPTQALSAVSQFFGLNHSDDDIEDIINGPIFTRNSKFDEQDYGAEQRDMDVSRIEERYGDILTQIEAWAGQTRLSNDVTLPLPNALVF